MTDQLTEAITEAFATAIIAELGQPIASDWWHEKARTIATRQADIIRPLIDLANACEPFVLTVVETSTAMSANLGLNPWEDD